MTKERKQEIQKALDELYAELDKCPDDVEPFTCKGEWYFDKFGNTYKGVGGNTPYIKSFNYWQTEEIAEKAYALQLRHRKMLNFVSQHQELGEGGYFIYQQTPSKRWNRGMINRFYPDIVAMTKETADLMLKDIENGSLDLS